MNNIKKSDYLPFEKLDVLKVRFYSYSPKYFNIKTYGTKKNGTMKLLISFNLQ